MRPAVSGTLEGFRATVTVSYRKPIKGILEKLKMIKRQTFRQIYDEKQNIVLRHIKIRVAGFRQTLVNQLSVFDSEISIVKSNCRISTDRIGKI